MTNLRKLQPSRKLPQVGDVFTFLLCDGKYTFGQVLDAGVVVDGGFRDLALVVVFASRSKTKDMPPNLVTSERIASPKLIPKVAWSRGYFETIGRAPVEWGPYCLKAAWGDYFDRTGKKLSKPLGMVLSMGVANYRVIEDEVCEWLGIPLSPD